MKGKTYRRSSFRGMLLRYMLLVSIVPILALGLFSVFSIYRTIRNNTNKLMDANLVQVSNSISISIKAYEDLEYQIYTDDNIVQWVKMIDDGKDVPSTVSRMRRYINGLLNTKEYIGAITIVTNTGVVIAYDTMTGVTTQSSWIDNFSKDFSEIYDEVTADYGKHVYSTEYASTFANKDFYLFHLAHRIVNYRNLEEVVGMVIISIDEDMLCDIYAPDAAGDDQSMYILDQDGRIISSKESKALIGTTINLNCESKAEQEREYQKGSLMRGRWKNTHTCVNENFGWTIVSISDDAGLKLTFLLQALYGAMTVFVILAIAFIVSYRISGRLEADIKRVSGGMGRAMEGDLNTRIELSSDTPEEIAVMANAYNDMIGKLKESAEKERIAIQKQQDAHIVALEAQINPHFLYNTLDTINWMAIEKEEYDISNAINALATILRYAIAKSNAAVTVRDEVEWLKKYIFLQQFRLKETIRCDLDIDPELMSAPIHKLLMQPFIENAIIHGFDGNEKNACLLVSISREMDDLVIRIIDNGKGMPPEMVDQINRGEIEAKDRTHIGMGNVITRMKMYYSAAAFVHVESREGEGTTITLRIPYRGK